MLRSSRYDSFIDNNGVIESVAMHRVNIPICVVSQVERRRVTMSSVTLIRSD